MKTSLKFTLLLAWICAPLAMLAEAPEGYYDACAGKSKSALKSQLHTIIKNHKRISYDGLWAAFVDTDVAPDGDYWWDIYTFEKVNTSTHTGMNREHSFPKSWWGGNKNDAYSDIVHLMPVNEWANNDRSNHPYAEVETERAPNYRCPSPNYKLGSPKSGMGGGDNIVFEPADEFKGDLARTYFYMVTCYQDLTWSVDGLRTLAQGVYPTLQPWALEMLLRWHRNDPVSDKERRRNDGVYARQNNRNPFIDHPEMVEHIWGSLMDEPWQDGEGPVGPGPVEPGDPASLTSPVDADIISFGLVEQGSFATHVIPVLGSGFTSSVTARISGPDADMYSMLIGTTPLQTLALPAAEINSQDGCYVTVRYMPAVETDAEAMHVATLTLSGKDMEEAVTVRLEGNCKSASVALPSATDDADARYFTIDGRMLPGRPAAPGIYIMVKGGSSYKYTQR